MALLHTTQYHMQVRAVLTCREWNVAIKSVWESNRVLQSNVRSHVSQDSGSTRYSSVY
jgi:hypothetical protein